MMTAHTEQLVAAPLIMTSTDPPAGHVQNDQNTSVTGTSHVGIECSIKDLYAGAEDNQGRFTWTDKYPEDLEEAAEDYNTIKHAILLRHKKCFNDSRKALEIDSIVIQSPLLKQILGGVLADYPGVTPSLDRLIFDAPFQPFIHRWQQISQALNQEQDVTAKSHLKLLYNTLKAELKETIAAKDDFIANKVITYQHLWTIFQPGCIVHSLEWGLDCGMEYIQGKYIKHSNYGPCFQLSCRQIDWDGEKFGYRSKLLLIQGFTGTKPITKLSTFPLEYHPNVSSITDMLVARGKVFEYYHGYHYKAYAGTALTQTPCGPIKVVVDSRIIIDRYAYSRFNPNQNDFLEPLEHGASNPKMGRESDSDSDSDSDVEDDYWSKQEEESDIDPAVQKNAPLSLTQSQLLICTAIVGGYALRTKRWLQFFIDNISDIQWNNNAFESLVLPEDQKDLILSFAESQILYKQQFDDFVSGKGRGIIMLLSGSPGVGKTLTAESVAEHMRVPLYMLSASDLGTISHEVENNLTKILEMVAKWNAVLLLDECDVFLEARNSNDLERNKLVSIFLRTLEYYEGILFLTTNRADNIDSAFQSRIHISLEYPPLSSESRKRVWTNFLNREIDHQLDEAQIEELAAIDLNGRQIKNILKSSQLLACRRKTPLKHEHLKIVLNIESRRRIVGGSS